MKTLLAMILFSSLALGQERTTEVKPEEAIRWIQTNSTPVFTQELGDKRVAEYVNGFGQKEYRVQTYSGYADLRFWDDADTLAFKTPRGAGLYLKALARRDSLAKYSEFKFSRVVPESVLWRKEAKQ